MSYLEKIESYVDDITSLNDFYNKGYIDLEQFMDIRDKIVDRIIEVSSEEKNIKEKSL